MLKKRKAMPYYQIIGTPKKYQAILNQNDMNPPVQSIINNEIQTANLTWTRLQTGTYEVTWPNFNSTINTIQVQTSKSYIILAAWDTGLGKLRIETFDVVTNALTDNGIDESYCEITAQQIYSE